MSSVIENGALQIVGKTSGGGMAGGKPVPVQTALGDPIPCNIKTNTNDKKGFYIDGEFTRASFEVLIDEQPFDAERLVLTNNRGVKLGEFRVQDIQHLDFVNTVKITV
jgi:hypothetical protein